MEVEMERPPDTHLSPYPPKWPQLEFSVEPPPPTQWTIFTDGSKHDTGTGFGVVAYEHDQIHREIARKVPNHCTVFQAEMAALQGALRIALTLPPASNIAIASDSISALNALTSTITKTKLILDTRAFWIAAERKQRLTMHWVKAHNDNTGNERADALAKMGRQQTNMISFPPPRSWHQNYLAKKMAREWQDLYESDILCDRARTFLPRTSDASNPSREGSDIISGHSYLQKHLKTVGFAKTSICISCNTEDQTIEHALLRCPASSHNRWRAETLLGAPLDQVTHKDWIDNKEVWDLLKTTIKEAHTTKTDPIQDDGSSEEDSQQPSP
jgi:ribonuclease HI